MVERRERPVLSGLLALVGVGLAVGLVLGLGALFVARTVGLDGGSSSAGSTSEESMYLPPPEKTTSSPGASSSAASPRPGPRTSSSPATQITLTTGQTAVGPMQRIDLSGSYPGGDGAILVVQRFQAGQWGDFPVTASVSGGSFSTYVQTGQSGVNRFRMKDSDSGATSNEIKVTVG